MASVRTAPRAPERGPIHGSAWKGFSQKFASTGVWKVLLAEAADDRLPSRPDSRIPSGPAARIPPSWAAGLFRAPLRSRAGRNGPKGAWTGPGPPETMPDRGGRADLGGGVGPSSCSRTVLLTTPVPCRRRSSIPTDGESSFCEVRRHGVLRSSLPASNVRATPKTSHMAYGFGTGMFATVVALASL